MAVLCGILCPTFALAQADGSKSPAPVADPTRPAYVTVGTMEAGNSAAVSRLTSIVQRKGARSYAVIDGVVVHVGGTLGDARLQQISENSVVLKTADSLETLTLTPGIEKKIKPLQTSKTKAATTNSSRQPAQAQTRDPS